MKAHLSLASCMVALATLAQADTIPATPESFAQAETAWNFTNWAKQGADEKIFHFRGPAPIGPAVFAPSRMVCFWTKPGSYQESNEWTADEL